MRRLVRVGRLVRPGVITGLLLTCGASSSVAQVDPRSALLEQAGWEALTEGHAHAAAAAFREGLTHDPRSPTLHLGAGAAAYAERRDADARTQLMRALALAPRLPYARSLLGRVQYRTGDLAAAIATLEAMVADGSTTAEASATLDRWRREAALGDRMQQVVGARFTISFEGPTEEALANGAIASLDRAYWRLGAVLGTYPNQPIGVVMYTAEQFTDITRAPVWAAGAYDGTIRVPIRGALQTQAELDRVLAHEFAHALVRTLAPRGVPSWLDEGLAASLEADDITWAERRVRTESALVPLQALTLGFSRLSGAQAPLAYATSALAARRLIDEAGGVAVANLLRDLGDGVGLETAFLHRIHHTLADFQAAGP